MQKNPYRIVGTVFSAIAAVEVVVVFCLLLSRNRTMLIVAAPFAIQCVIFGGIGAGFLISQHCKDARRERLIANGYYEMATVVGIEQNPYVRVNRSSPYHVICRIEREGVLHEYRSEGYAFHPGVKPGDVVPVYLDRQNDKNYYVDVDSVAPSIIRH